MPHAYDDLWHAWQEGAQPDESYQKYYQLLASFSPQSVEAQAMLGFCSYLSHDTNQAIASYQQAVRLNPQFFWPYYNLGVIAYQSQEYAKAQEFFQQALRVDPKATIQVLMSSKIYIDILRSPSFREYNILEHLQAGYQKAYALMLLSNQHKQPSSPETVQLF